jgi:hypothetical protein
MANEQPGQVYADHEAGKRDFVERQMAQYENGPRKLVACGVYLGFFGIIAAVIGLIVGVAASYWWVLWGGIGAFVAGTLAVMGGITAFASSVNNALLNMQNKRVEDGHGDLVRQQGKSMDIFTDPRTTLAFPAKIGSWIRQSVTTYPLQSAGYSVIYELRGWLGARKVLVSVDVYDKACPGIPSGPHSAHVAIELHNCIHAMFPNVPPVDVSRIDAYLADPRVAADSLVGRVDAGERIRSAGGELTMNGVDFYFAAHLLGHRGHFVKFQESDLTKGSCSTQVSALVEFFLAQMHEQQFAPPPPQTGAEGLF